MKCESCDSVVEAGKTLCVYCRLYADRFEDYLDRLEQAFAHEFGVADFEVVSGPAW